jgi:nucleotide-binding universal stress UspA family protein
MKSLSVLVLRFKRPEGRAWKVPLNFRWGGREYPVGLFLITLALFTLSIVNVVTKKAATISGVAFTLVFFSMFALTEYFNRRRMQASQEDASQEKFRLEESASVSPASLEVRPGCVLVAVRNPHRLTHLRRVMERTDPARLDIVVVSIRTMAADEAWTPGQLFAQPETEVFSQVVATAEKAGKTVKLLVVPGSDPMSALVQTAAQLGASRIVLGTSPRQTVAEQGLAVGQQWEKLPAPRPPLSLEVVPDDSSASTFVNLGPHPPRLWPEDIELVHELWLEMSTDGLGHSLHHRDVVGYALRRLKNDYQGAAKAEILAGLAERKLNPPLT